MSALPEHIADFLLTLPDDQAVCAWLDGHASACQVDLVIALKHIVDGTNLRDTARAKRAAVCAALVAARVPDAAQSAAHLLAAWALGNAVIFLGNHTEAVQQYQQALLYAQQLGDVEAQARLTGNLSFALSEQGQYQEARRLIEMARQHYPIDGPPGPRSSIEQTYGVILDRLEESQAALDAYQRAVELAQAAGAIHRVAENRTNMAYIYEKTGQLRHAERTYQEARILAEEHGQQLTVARIAMNLGTLFSEQGRLAEAQQALHQAYTQFVAQGVLTDAANVQTHQATLYRLLGLTETAMELAQQAAEQLAVHAAPEDRAFALLALLRAQRQAGYVSSALTTTNHLLALWHDLDNHLRIIELRGERAWLLLECGAPHQALDEARHALAALDANTEQRPLWMAPVYLAQAIALRQIGFHARARTCLTDLIGEAERTGDHWTLQAALVNLARLDYTSGNYLAAHCAIARAADDVDLVRTMLTVEELKARFLQQHADIYDLLVILAAAQGDAASVLAAMLRAKGGGILDLLSEERGWVRQASPEQHDLDGLRQQLAWERFQAAQVSASSMCEQHRRHQQRSQEIERRILAMLRQRQHQCARSSSPAYLSREHLATCMPPNSVLLEYYIAEGMIWCVLLQQDATCTLHSLGTWESTEHELLAELDLIFESATEQVDLTHPRRLPRARAAQTRLYALWQRLIEPLGPLPPHVLVVPHGELGHVPFAALWNGTHYLMEFHTIALLPSGALLGTAFGTETELAEPLVIGYDAAAHLPATQHEAHLIGHLLNTPYVYVGDTATCAVLRAMQLPPAVLHIAAHAELRSDAPLFSTVRLSDGDMALETWFDLPLHGTRLVVLSACDTGRVADHGTPLLAFQSALLAAGVQTVLGSLWQAHDSVTALLMEAFYRAWLAGKSPAAALRAAQYTLCANPATAHPALWASFICSGPAAFSLRNPSEK